MTNSERMSEKEVERYARHIFLREVGGAGQNRLRATKVLVVGAGGLGSPALQYLAACGVGTIGIADMDTVSLSNLQRQVLFQTSQLGEKKTSAAKKFINNLNPGVSVIEHAESLSDTNADDLISGYDVVLDGTDNFPTRRLVNKACVEQGKPLVSGAISQWEGQITLIDHANGTPCFECIFPNEPANGLAPNCAEGGVIGALPGIVGSLMALEAIKLITGAGRCLRGEMLLFDGLWSESRKIRVTKSNDCSVCSRAMGRVPCPA